MNYSALYSTPHVDQMYGGTRSQNFHMNEGTWDMDWYNQISLHRSHLRQRTLQVRCHLFLEPYHS